MFRRLIAAVLATTLALNIVGCAQRPSSIKPNNVSSAMYQGMECNTLYAEKSRVDTQLADLSDAQNSAASTDTALFWVGFLLFWPAWFGWAATDDHASSIAQLKGESDAMNVAYTARCMNAQRTPAEATGSGS